MLNAGKHLIRTAWITILEVRMRCFSAFGMALFWVLVSFQGHAQVANDNIENRRLLRAEEIITSSTVGCTVQRGCVDERLTGKCIEYHNDQWFEFRPPASGTYYINIGGQRCRDVRGVQLVVLTGTPCQPATYRILSCTSLGTQDDLFVALPGLRMGQAYLLDVDGYLKDYCTFTLQVSGQARGMPVVPAPAVPASLPSTSRVVQLAWQVPDSLASTRYCRVLRRELHEFRAHEVWREPVVRDSYGQLRPAYSHRDTLPAPGQYLYQLVAVGEATDPSAPPPTVLQQQWRSYSQLRPIMPSATAAEAGFLVLPLARYPPNAQLTVVISDPATGKILRKLPLLNRPQQPSQGRLYAQEWLAAGLKAVAVAITCYPSAGGTPYTDQLQISLLAP
jgi:hypothetical protein